MMVKTGPLTRPDCPRIVASDQIWDTRSFSFSRMLEPEDTLPILLIQSLSQLEKIESALRLAFVSQVVDQARLRWRAMDRFGWDFSTAEDRIETYLRFLALKSVLSDEANALIAPPAEVDAIWHLHICNFSNVSSE